MTSIFIAVAVIDRFGKEEMISAHPTREDAERACGVYATWHSVWYTYVHELKFNDGRQEDI